PCNPPYPIKLLSFDSLLLKRYALDLQCIFISLGRIRVLCAYGVVLFVVVFPCPMQFLPVNYKWSSLGKQISHIIIRNHTAVSIFGKEQHVYITLPCKIYTIETNGLTKGTYRR